MNRVANTVDRISAVEPLSGQDPTRRLVIAATFTAEPLEESLVFWCNELRLQYQVEFAPYNQIFQQLLDHSSALSSNERGVNVVLLRLEDLGLFGNPSAAADLLLTVDQLVTSLRSSKAIGGSRLLVCICPPSEGSIQVHESAANYNLLEAYLVKSLESVNGARVLRYQDVLARYPVKIKAMTTGREQGHIPYPREFFTALGTSVVRLLHSMEASPAKVLVLDCDQTLWKGVCGEDGPTGVFVDKARRSVQEFALRQRASGVLICLCSKNAEEDVFSVLEQHPDMILRREHIVASRINWELKSTNLRSLAKELNLGLDSFVFLDDSVVECGEVRANAPEVLTLQLPEDESCVTNFLENIWVFEGSAKTREDSKRSEFYRQDAERESLRRSTLTFNDFIAPSCPAHSAHKSVQ